NRDDVYKETDSISNKIKSVSGGESFEKLVPSETSVTTTITDDKDTVYVDVTANKINLIEGDAEVTYTVTLRNQDGLEVKNHAGLNITLSNGVKIYIPMDETSGTAKGIATVGSNTIKVQTIVETATADSGKQFEDIQAGKTVTVNVSSSKLQNDIARATEDGKENILDEDKLDEIDGKGDGQTATKTIEGKISVFGNDSISDKYKSISQITFYGKTYDNISSKGTEIVGEYGTLIIDSKGNFTYTVDNENKTVDALNVGDKLAEHFTYTTSNGKTAVLTVEVEGRNDAPIISKIETNGVTLTGIYNDYRSDNISENITAKDLIKQDGSNSYQFKNENNTLKMDLGTTKTNVDISYEGKNASYKNILGYYEKNADGTVGNFKIIFVDDANLSKGNTTSLSGKTGEIGFFLISQGASNKDIMTIINEGDYKIERTDDGKITFTSGKKSATANNVYYTDESLSTDKIRPDHTIALKSDKANSLVIAFEDQDGTSTDFDYNDFVISVTFTPSESLSNKLFTNIDFSDVDDDSLSEATVTLTNAIDGDKINIAGDLKEGITYTTEYKDGKLIIKFSGKASHETYEEALEAIRFSTKNSENERELKFDIEIKDPNGKTDKQSVVIIGKGFANDAPEIQDEEVKTKEDVPYNFSKEDFDSYSDKDSMDTIKIVTLPDSKTEGVLKYDGEVLTVGKEIKVTDLGKLVFEPVANSDKDASFTFQVSDDKGAYSDIKTMTIEVEAVADAPTVSVSVVKAGTIEVSVGTGSSSNNENNSNIKELNVLNTEKAVNDWGNNSQDIKEDLIFSNESIDKTFQNFSNVSVTTGSGNDTLRFTSVNHGKVNTGSGDDKVIFNQNSSVSLNLGNGDNKADFVGGFNGSVSSDGGNDKILINQSAEGSINLGEGNNTISIGEGLSGSVATGSGNDTLIVGQNVKNKSSIDLGDGNNSISIRETFEGTILTGTGSDKIIINGNINNGENSISTGAGNDFVQINGEINNTLKKLDLGEGNDGFRYEPTSFNAGNENAIDGGKGFDTLYLKGNSTEYRVYVKNEIPGYTTEFRDFQGNYKAGIYAITWDNFVKLNQDIEGFAQKEFYIMHKDTSNTNRALKVTNFESISFDHEEFGGKEETTTVHKYDITVNAQLTDKDGSEELSNVTIKNIPNGSTLYNGEVNEANKLNANPDGSYTVKVDANGEAKLSLTSESEISQDKLDDVQVSATSTDKSTDGTSEVSQAISFDGSGDIDLSNLKNIITELKEINLENGKENKLSLTLDDVLKLSGDDNTIKITGDDNLDGVSFKNEDGKVWEQQQSITEGDKTFDVYSGSIGDQTVQVKVEQPISDGITC
ncbi:VCBS domain-containing protein, partial [Aliarcobacter butzleri]|uniref:VCBS domain-containing protein n=1 Tax=Aliarcobacter butzleri TaxID=28197 RepID=UPI0021B31009